MHAPCYSAKLCIEADIAMSSLRLLISFVKIKGWDMPVELLVPITIFVLGVIVSVKLGSIGIQRVSESNK